MFVDFSASALQPMVCEGIFVLACISKACFETKGVGTNFLCCLRCSQRLKMWLCSIQVNKLFPFHIHFFSCFMGGCLTRVVSVDQECQVNNLLGSSYYLFSLKQSFLCARQIMWLKGPLRGYLQLVI